MSEQTEKRTPGETAPAPDLIIGRNAVSEALRAGRRFRMYIGPGDRFETVDKVSLRYCDVHMGEMALMVSSSLIVTFLIARVMVFRLPMNPGILSQVASIAMNAPPKVMKIEGGSMNAATPAIPSSP